jgi:hypothetical protein
VIDEITRTYSLGNRGRRRAQPLGKLEPCSELARQWNRYNPIKRKQTESKGREAEVEGERRAMLEPVEPSRAAVASAMTRATWGRR